MIAKTTKSSSKKQSKTKKIEVDFQTFSTRILEYVFRFEISFVCVQSSKSGCVFFKVRLH